MRRRRPIASATSVRARAAVLHEELGPLYGLMEDFVARWSTAAEIDARRIRFRIELVRVLARLGWRMMKENRELYPMADAELDVPGKASAAVSG